VSPLSPMPDRTLLHEVAHVVLGHTVEGACRTGGAADAPQPSRS
jgi:hypothetical protein